MRYRTDDQRKRTNRNMSFMQLIVISYAFNKSRNEKKNSFQNYANAHNFMVFVWYLEKSGILWFYPFLSLSWSRLCMCVCECVTETVFIWAALFFLIRFDWPQQMGNAPFIAASKCLRVYQNYQQNTLHRFVLFILVNGLCEKGAWGCHKEPTMSINHVSLFNQQRIFVTEKLLIQTALATGKPITQNLHICNARTDKIQDIAYTDDCYPL